MKKRILAYLLSATLVVGLVPATAWAEELPQQSAEDIMVEEQQNDTEGGAVAPEVNPEETPETAPEEDANSEGSNDSTVDETEGTTEDADSEEGANNEDGAAPEEDKAAPEEKPEQVPMMTLAEAEPVATDEAVIKVGDYEALDKAIKDAKDGDEIVLTGNISYPTNGAGLLNITKSITLDGKGFTISGYGSRGKNSTTLAINDGVTSGSDVDVTLKNLKINNDTALGRAVETRGHIGTLTIENCTFECVGAGNTQVMTIGDSQSTSANVNIIDSTFTAGDAGYPIISFNPFNGNITDSTISGYCGIFFKGVDGSTGSIGSVVNATNTKFDCPNVHTDASQSNFGVFVFSDQNIEVNLENCTIDATEKNTASQPVILEHDAAKRRGGCKVSVTGKDTRVTGEVLLKKWVDVTDADREYTVTGGTFTFDPSEYVPSTHSIKEVDGKFVVDTVENNAVAKIGDTHYNTLEEAVNKVESGQIITLLKDTTVGSEEKGKNLFVVNGVDFTINLNGKTITGDHQIAIGLYHNDAKVLLKNGTIHGGSEATLYTIFGSFELDHCTVTAEKGAAAWADFTTDEKFVIKDSSLSSDSSWAVYHNGSYPGFQLEVMNSTLTSSDIQAVYISGSKEITEQFGANQKAVFTNTTIRGLSGIEGKYTDITLNNCNITSTATKPTFEQNNNGSTAFGFAVVSTDNSMSPEIPAPTAIIKIDGGYYKGLIGLNQFVDIKTEATYEISGGYFTSDPGAYVVEGKASLESDKAGYTYMVGDKLDDVIPEKPATAPPAVEVGKEIPVAQQPAVEKTAKSTNADSVLTEAARATKLDEGTKQTAVQEAERQLSAKADDVTVYKQTYLEVEATNAVVVDNKMTELTLDITPMMQVVASTAKSANNIDLYGKDKNAVKVGEAKELTINTPSVITVTLPDDFKVEDNTVYIKHEAQNGTYFYTAEVAQDKTVTFTSKHGFSPFTFMTTNEAVAEIDGVGYETLQEAINHVKDGETIKLLKKSDENIYVRNRISFTLDESVAELTGSIKAGSRYRMSAKVEGARTTYTFTKKSSGSSGSSSSSQEYKVTIADGIENGKVKVDPTKAEKGDKVTITVTPNKGYEINKVYAKDADGDKLELKDKGNGEYTFTMPDSKVEVKATFVKAEEEKPAEPEEIPAAEKIVLTVNERAAMVFGNVVVNDVAPIIRNDRTMLPIRFVAKNLGAEVIWDAQFQKVSITKDDLKIEIIIGSPVAFVNGENVTLDSPAFIENSRTYLPLRFVAENLGATVLWDAKAQEVTIVPEKAAETK